MAEVDSNNLGDLVDDDDAAVASVAVLAAAGGGHMQDLSKYDLPSSPELECTGCRSKSKMDCPIQVMKGGEKRQIQWGKTTTRKVKCRRTNKRVHLIRKTGDWCRICHNIWRLHDKRKYKKNMKLFKEDLTSKKEVRDAFDNNHSEYVHQRVGGDLECTRSRAGSLLGSIPV